MKGTKNCQSRTTGIGSWMRAHSDTIKKTVIGMAIAKASCRSQYGEIAAAIIR
jgi:hypothetical protein